MTGLEIVRAGADEASFNEVFGLLLDLHKAGGYATLDVETAALNAYAVLKEGMTFVAKLDGKAIGTLALTELKFWYAKQTFLQDAWLYVAPEYRKGVVGIQLMRAAKDEAQARNKIAFVTLNNPDRRPKATVMSLESQIAGYVPVGYTLKVR